MMAKIARPMNDRPSSARSIRVVGVVRQSRAALLRGTALQAAVLTVIALPTFAVSRPAAAQPAATARPTGGTVVAGAAQITQPNAATTVITQSTDRAAVNWTSFSVGAQQSVDFIQPSTHSMTLNRVTGPDPSAIAGRIQANGGVILTNPNGVTFYKGSQVNAQDVIVSTIGITNQNFMNGKLVFDQPGNAGAAIANAGTLTVKDTGLAALVAPQVANSGVISARLGHAVLAGAAAATLDMYGDGLLSVDVTRQVTQVAAGPDGKPATALVTNTGTILAAGGHIVMTAQAADGVVQNLVAAGGKIGADSIGEKTGSVAITGTGGSIVISGRVMAAGFAAGTTGGKITLDASDGVTVAPGARVSASGAAGGGTVAIGTTMARAVGGPAVTPKLTAAATTIASGAHVTANATHAGNGGRVTVLSTNRTVLSGDIQAKGGPTAGNGGTVEVSTGGTMLLGGSVDVTAPHGVMGNITLDPYDLIIEYSEGGTTPLTDNTDPNLAYSTGGTASGDYAIVTPSQIAALHGNVHLQAVDNITVYAPVTLTTAGQALELEAGNSLTVASGSGISTAGNIELLAASSAIPGYNTAGILSVLAPVSSSGGSVLLQGGSGGITIGDHVTAASGSFVDLQGDSLTILTAGQASLSGGAGGLVAAANGEVIIEPYTAGRPVELIGADSTPTANRLSVNQTELALISTATLALGNSAAGAITIGKSGDGVALGTITTLNLVSAGAIGQGAALSVGTLSAQGTAIAFPNTANSIANTGTIAAGSGNVTLADAETLSVLGPISASGNVNLSVIGDLDLASSLTAGSTANLTATGSINEATGGGIFAGTLAGSAGLAANLTQTNEIGTIADFTSTTGFTLVQDSTALTVAGTLSDSTAISLSTQGMIFLTGTLAAPLVSLATTETLPALDSGTTPVTSGQLTSIESIIQSGGGITAGTLTITAAAGVDMQESAPVNSIANLGAITATGLFNLIDTNAAVTLTGPIAVSGPVLYAGAGNNFYYQVYISSPGAITVAAPVSGAVVGLYAGEALTEPSGGAITAQYLFGTGSAVSLPQTANAVGEVDSLISTGNLVLTDSIPLTINGVVSAGTGNSLIINNDALTLGASAAISAPSGTVTLATVTAGDALAIGNATSLGSLTAITADTLVIGSGTTGTITINAQSSNFDASNVGTLALVTGSGGNVIAQGPDGVIANTLTGNVGNGATLTGANQIATLGSFTAAGPFYLTDSNPGSTPLTIAGPLSAANIQVISTSTPIAITGPVSSGIVVLTASGAPGGISETGSGAITSSNLVVTESSTGAVALTGQNTISAVGGVSAGSGGFTLTDATSLVLPSGSAISTTGPVALNATGGLTLNGAVGGTGASLSLIATGTISQGSAGTLTGTSLTGRALTVNLPQTTNAVGTLGAFTSTSGFYFADGIPLSVTGPVTDLAAVALGAEGALSIAGNLTAPLIGLVTDGAITLGGNINASKQVALSSTGAMTQSSGTIATPLLSGTGSSSVSLGSANAIASLGSFSASGAFSLTDSEALAVTAQLSAASVSLATAGALSETTGSIVTGTLTGSASSASLTAANQIGTLGNFAAPNGFLLTDTSPLTIAGALTAGPFATLNISGLVSETGSITATTLNAAAGTLTLNGANTIGTLALASAAGGILFNDTTALMAAGTIGSTAAPTALAAAGTISVSGSLSGSTVTLAATGAISDTATAVINAGTLSGSGTTFTLTSSGNTIGALGAITAGTALSLTETPGLVIVGAVSAPTVTLATGGALTESGSGAITATNLSAGAAGIALGGNNAITSVGSLAGAQVNAVLSGDPSAGSVVLNDTINLSITGPVTGANVVLTGSGVINATGAVTAGTLTVSAPAVSLSSNGNDIFQVGSATTTGLLEIVGTGSGGLTVSGPVNAGTLDLVTSGLAITGAVTAGSVLLSVGESAAETGSGAITTGNLSGSVNGGAAFGGANAISTLGSFTVTAGKMGDAFSLNDTVPLTVTGPVSAASLALTGSGAITLTGAVNVSQLSVTAGGSVIQSAGTITAGTLTGSAVGSAVFGPDAAGPVANIGTLGAFSVGTGTLSVASSQAMTVTGPVTAGTLALSSPGTITLAGGSINTSLGTIAVTQGAVTQGAVTQGAVTQGAVTQGAGAAQIVQTGTTTVAPVSGGGTSSMVFMLPGSGTMTFSDLSAPTTSVVLDTGSGTATGQVNVGVLTVNGQSGSASLTGSVNGFGGAQAAQAASIAPAINSNYTLNGCEIAAANCGIVVPQIQLSAADLQIESILLPPNAGVSVVPGTSNSAETTGGAARSAFRVPFLSGLLAFVFSRDVDDPDLVLPNISDRDY